MRLPAFQLPDHNAAICGIDQNDTVARINTAIAMKRRTPIARGARSCVSAWGLDADRRRGHRCHANKIKTLDSRVRQLRGQNSISIHMLSPRCLPIAVAGSTGGTFDLLLAALRAVCRAATLRCLGLLFLDREVTLRFETVFFTGTFSGSGSDHRRHHRSPVTANRPTGQVRSGKVTP